jgi:colicin import membrane protein
MDATQTITVAQGQAWDQKFVTQHPKSIALIRAMKPRALKYATHHMMAEGAGPSPQGTPEKPQEPAPKPPEPTPVPPSPAPPPQEPPPAPAAKAEPKPEPESWRTQEPRLKPVAAQKPDPHLARKLAEKEARAQEEEEERWRKKEAKAEAVRLEEAVRLSRKLGKKHKARPLTVKSEIKAERRAPKVSQARTQERKHHAAKDQSLNARKKHRVSR